MTQGGRTVCYWYTKYPPGSLSASTVGGRRVCSQLPSHSVCGHSTIVAWCVRVIQQSSSSSLQTTIVGPTKVAWCVPSFILYTQKTGFDYMMKVAMAIAKASEPLIRAAQYNIGRAYYMGYGAKQSNEMAEK